MITFGKNDHITCNLIKSEAQNAAYTASIKATNEAVMFVTRRAVREVLNSTWKAINI